MMKFYKVKILVLIIILITSTIYILSNYFKEKKQSDIYNDLTNKVEENTTLQNSTDNDNGIQNDNEDVQIKENGKNITNYSNINLLELKKQNSDLIGWIRIKDTNINYPVMQNGEYYLHNNFYKQKSSLGTPFLASYCNINTSDNLIIYGHHIKSGKMFADLEYYKNYNFYSNHKAIKFYVLENDETKEHCYEILSAFKTTANDNGFKYYEFYKANDETEFNSFIEKCKSMSFYNTGVTAYYGDKLLTLSTCEYSQENGRIVVVAKEMKLDNEK